VAVARLLGAHHDASVGSRVAPPFVAIAVLVVAAAMVAIAAQQLMRRLSLAAIVVVVLTSVVRIIDVRRPGSARCDWLVGAPVLRL
jgi:hypothetical protein